MAHYHLSVKNGKSGGGGAHSDYIEREGKYAHRGDLEFSQSGNMPDFAKDDPSEFWRMADIHERANGRPYKEIEFSLPRGLSHEQRMELAQEYVNNIVGDKQPYSFAIHNPISKEDGLENPHVHFMFSERSINEDTSSMDADLFFKRNGATKNRAFTSRAFVWEARKEWTRTANHFLERNDFSERIDERSYKDRNIDLQSTNQNIFKQTFETKEKLRDIQRDNGDKIINDPTIALRALTSNNSTFTKRDLETFIFRHTDGAEQYTTAYNSVVQSDQFVKILDKETFTTKELLDVEKDIINRVGTANKKPVDSLSDRQQDNNQKVTDSRTFNDEQKQAFDNLTSNAQIASVNGSAGTGKSYVLGAVNEYYKAENKKVHGIALQGITAQAMQNDAGIKSSTIAGFLIKHEKGEIKLDKNSVLVLDEAGMVGSRDFQKLLEATEKSGAQIRMVGDSKQLNAVSAGNAYGTIQETLSKDNQTELVRIMRQRSEEMKSASMDLSKHDIKSALDKYDQLGKLNEFDTQESAQIKTALDWSESKAESKIMLAYTNADVQSLNGYAREILREKGEIGKEEHYANTYKGVMGFSTNDEIVFKENNKDMGVLNGSRGKVISVHGDDGNAHSLAVQLADGKKVNVNLKEYDKLTHGYATTVHGSQGLTVSESHVLLSKNMNANLAYVALTRHKDDIKINYSREQFDSQMKVNGQEITAKENIAREIGKEEVKTFTGKEIRDESFEHIKAEYSIDRRETVAEKYELINQAKEAPQQAEIKAPEQQETIAEATQPTEQKQGFFGRMKEKLGFNKQEQQETKEEPKNNYDAQAEAFEKEQKMRADMAKEAEQKWAKEIISIREKLPEDYKDKYNRFILDNERTIEPKEHFTKFYDEEKQKITRYSDIVAFNEQFIRADRKNGLLQNHFTDERKAEIKASEERMQKTIDEKNQEQSSNNLFASSEKPTEQSQDRNNLFASSEKEPIMEMDLSPSQERLKQSQDASKERLIKSQQAKLQQERAQAQIRDYRLSSENFRFYKDHQNNTVAFDQAKFDSERVKSPQELAMDKIDADRKKAVEEYAKRTDNQKETVNNDERSERIISHKEEGRLQELETRKEGVYRTPEELEERAHLQAKNHQQSLMDKERNQSQFGKTDLSAMDKAENDLRMQMKEADKPKLSPEDALKKFKEDQQAKQQGGESSAKAQEALDKFMKQQQEKNNPTHAEEQKQDSSKEQGAQNQKEADQDRGHDDQAQKEPEQDQQKEAEKEQGKSRDDDWEMER